MAIEKCLASKFLVALHARKLLLGMHVVVMAFQVTPFVARVAALVALEVGCNGIA